MIAATAILLCISATSGPAEVLYESDLAALPNGAAQVEGLDLGGGTCRVEDGWLTVSSEQSNPYLALAAKHERDFTFRAMVRNARECHWVGLVARGVYRLEVNNQFVELRLLRKRGDEWDVVDEVGGYSVYAHNTQDFELRLVAEDNRICGFIDDKLLVEFEDTEPVAEGGDYAMLSGWGTDCAWSGISLTDERDLGEWPYEEKPPPAPKELVEVTLVRGLREDQVYFDGQTCGLRVRVRNPSAEARTVYLGLPLVDVWGKEVAARRETLEFGAGEERELTIEYQPSRRGCYKVPLWAGATENDLGWVEDLGSFVVVSEAVHDRPRNAGSCFGGHMDGINLEWHLQAARRVGVQWARCHNMMQWTWWSRIQPNGPDEWLWSDDAQKLNDDLGYETLGQFLYCPDWATSWNDGDPGLPRTYAPKDWAAFRKYVYETVSHYKGSITYWEVWNEPHFHGFWRGTAEEYAELLRVCWEEAKRADPDCIIMGGGGPTVRQHDWIERVLEAGGGEYMDGFTIHYLEPDIARERMPKLRKLLDDHDVTGPIWNSEENVPGTSFLDQARPESMEPEARYHYRNACFELVRRYMENLSNGVERVFYYDLADPWRFKMFDKPRTDLEWGPTYGTMWDEGRQYRPVAATHAALALALEGKTYVSRLDRGNLRVFFFEGPEGSAAVQYAMFDSFMRREELRLALPEGANARDLTVIDIMGNESGPVVEGGEVVLLLAREPVFVVTEGSLEGMRALYGS